MLVPYIPADGRGDGLCHISAFAVALQTNLHTDTCQVCPCEVWHGEYLPLHPLAVPCAPCEVALGCLNMAMTTYTPRTSDMVALAVSLNALEARVQAYGASAGGEDTVEVEVKQLREQLAAKEVRVGWWGNVVVQAM